MRRSSRRPLSAVALVPLLAAVAVASGPGAVEVVDGPISPSLADAQPATSTPVVWQAQVVEPGIVANGHKPKALGDFDGDGRLDVFAYYAGAGMYWYEYPAWERHRMNGARGGEDARAVDVDGDGDTDVVVSGTRWLENPLAGGGDPRGTWPVHEIGGADSHDLLTGDVNKDGRPDVVVLGGTYFQTASSWRYVSNALFPDRGYKGSELAGVDRDGDLDLLAPTASAPYKIAWWANPLPASDPATTPWTKRVIATAWKVTAIGIGDMDGDGLRDVVMAPLKSTGGLWWLKAPADPTAPGDWRRHLVDPTVSFVHQTSVFAEDVDLDGSLDILLAEQEQSAHKRLAVYYNGVAAGEWPISLLATTGGHNPKVGDMDSDGDVDILNANHGFYGADNPVVLWRNGVRGPEQPPGPGPTASPTPSPSPTLSPSPSPPAPAGWGSDDFSGSTLGNTWSTVDPVGDGTVAMTSPRLGEGGVSLSVPAGASHDAWAPNRALRITRAAPTGDFSAEVKFVTVPTLTHQLQGLMVESSAGTVLRFDVYHSQDSLLAFAASLTPTTATKRLSVPVQVSSHVWLQVQRAGTRWTFKHSTDSTTWTTIGSFTDAIIPTRLGVFAGNHGRSGTPAPAWTATADYLFDTNARIDLEDG